jgi:serine phosphatase RsbU (regulator of sigma subunit)
MPPLVLVSSAAGEGADLRDALTAAGFGVRGHPLGATPATEFGPIAAAVVDVGARADAAAAQTRRWRAELGDEHVPVVWVLPAADAGLAVRGFDAGADAVLTRPLDPAVLAAQVRATARARTTAARVATRAAEARLLGDRLQQVQARLDRELAAARRVQHALLPRELPAGVAVVHRPRARTGGDFHDARRLDAGRVGFVVADVVEPGGAGALVGVVAARAVVLAEGERIVPPDDVLAGVNRELLGLGFDDRPLVAMLAGVLDVGAGTLQLARAGLPAPVLVPADGDPTPLVLPGPFLGVGEAVYPVHTVPLRRGDKLLVGTDGTRPDGTPGPADDGAMAEAATRYRHLTGQAFADAVARDLLQHVRHEDDFTLMVVGTEGPAAGHAPGR